ncbi:hypothetical protein Y032_0165g24 [Ancylostoma ceylanicum]|uniref:Uncharacterized protein n=1 Tax=Ancylostoma ceylanicum TaxID=53326 RepID=A0A016SWV1_9BILA|nr:hypothetical protein Y032_0165g24 [Ancylostoma ceylanicum]
MWSNSDQSRLWRDYGYGAPVLWTGETSQIEQIDVECIILAREADISERKTLEALWISFRNPPMNNKNECLSIANDFMPFVPLCEL